MRVTTISPNICPPPHPAETITSSPTGRTQIAFMQVDRFERSADSQQPSPQVALQRDTRAAGRGHFLDWVLCPVRCVATVLALIVYCPCATFATCELCKHADEIH